MTQAIWTFINMDIQTYKKLDIRKKMRLMRYYFGKPPAPRQDSTMRDAAIEWMSQNNRFAEENQRVIDKWPDIGGKR